MALVMTSGRTINTGSPRLTSCCLKWQWIKMVVAMRFEMLDVVDGG